MAAKNDGICLAIWERCHKDMALGRTKDQVESSLVLDNINPSTANRQVLAYSRWLRDPTSVKPPQGWEG